MWGGNPISKKWGETGNVALSDGTGQGNHIAVFPTFVHGICAQIDLWRSARYRGKRFADAIDVWSGGNSVKSYIRFVKDRVPGMTEDTIINDVFLSGPSGVKFLKAQAWHEAGRPYPAPDGDWIEAQRRVFSGTKKMKIPPPPDIEPPLSPPTKPIIKSKTFWGSVVSAITAIAGAITDPTNLAIILCALVIVGIAGYIIWERNGKPDIVGWFR